MLNVIYKNWLHVEGNVELSNDITAIVIQGKNRFYEIDVVNKTYKNSF